MKNKTSIILIGILLCISIGVSSTVSATSPHSVWGYIYIKDMNQQNPTFVLAPANVNVTLEFFRVNVSHITNATNPADPFYGFYQIDFSGFEEQTGAFKITYDDHSDLIPVTNKTVTINEASSEEGKGWNYHYDLYIIIPEDETQTQDPPNNGGGENGNGETSPLITILLIPPIADASNTPRFGFVDEPILLDGSESYDEDGSIVNYSWDIQNKRVFGEKISYTFKDAGLYHVVLTVTDDSAQKNIDSFSISIETGNNPPRDISFTGPLNLRRQTLVLYTISAVDPDNDTLIYSVDWGDDTLGTISPALESTTPFETSHRWQTYGVYTVQITVKDQNNATASKSFNIYIDSQYIDGIIKGLLIDEDGDGIYDSFLEKETGVKTQVQQKNETTFLIDVNNDGVMDYLFDSYTNTVSMEKQEINEESNEPLPLLLIGGILFILLILIVVGVVVYRNQQQSKTSKK